jgi:pimeloyl-ACP methyl ester carboxylesterase
VSVAGTHVVAASYAGGAIGGASPDDHQHGPEHGRQHEVDDDRDVPPPPPVTWTPCGAPAECGRIAVPLDYAHPRGPSITLALSRVKAADAKHRVGALLVNPGGPGGSGLDLPLGLLGQAHQEGGPLAAALDRFDLIGFDPRGVGASSSVNCIDNPDAFYATDPTPDSQEEKRALIASIRAFARACLQRTGALLQHVGTVDAARDMDQIRRALGDTKISYLGFSYGTELGATYADLFPSHVRAAVLDGAVDMSLDGPGLIREQALAMERAFHVFAANCAARPSCAFYSAGDPERAFDRLLHRLDVAPEAVGARVANEGKARTVAGFALFVLPSVRPLVELGLAQAAAGDGSILLNGFDLYAERRPDGTYSNGIDATVAVNCLDYRWPRGERGYDAIAARPLAAAPRFGPTFEREYLPCAYWPFNGQDRPVPKADGAPPIVVVGSTGDPATPYEWAQAMARQLESGVLLTRVGEGHTALGVSRCIDDALATYLSRLTVPKPGTTCPSN